MDIICIGSPIAKAIGLRIINKIFYRLLKEFGTRAFLKEKLKINRKSKMDEIIRKFVDYYHIKQRLLYYGNPITYSPIDIFKFFNKPFQK